jgi:hypothetical protein
MGFVPAGEIIGEKHQVRTVRVAGSPVLPDGEYGFVDTCCTDAGCDCLKTMIQLIHNGRFVALINYGWESPFFYEKWMGGDAGIPPMSGPSIDITSPDLVNRDGILDLFCALMNDEWKKRFKRHYALVKARLAEAKRKP